MDESNFRISLDFSRRCLTSGGEAEWMSQISGSVWISQDGVSHRAAKPEWMSQISGSVWISRRCLTSGGEAEMDESNFRISLDSRRCLTSGGEAEMDESNFRISLDFKT